MVTTEFIIDVDKYFALSTFLMPAIIIIIIRSMITPINCRSFSKDIFNFLGYSIVYFVIFQLVFLILNIWFKSFSLINIFAVENLFGWINFILYVLYVLIFPILIGLLIGKLDQKDWIKEKLQKIFKFSVDNGILTTWEELPSYERNSKVEVTLKNGTIITGILSENSKISRSFEHKDIYITKVEKINDKLIEVQQQIWINGNEIVSIIFTKDHNILNETNNQQEFIQLLYELIKSVEMFRANFVAYIKAKEEKEDEQRKDDNNEYTD